MFNSRENKGVLLSLKQSFKTTCDAHNKILTLEIVNSARANQECIQLPATLARADQECLHSWSALALSIMYTFLVCSCTVNNFSRKDFIVSVAGSFEIFFQR